ncbi:uncharacterized protein LOC108087111 [Drosophila ficusphila]|uniref:uncharacterized protein LOC108087111 n=1 Tax=Drosophila ficusphila TaxID=30025 RepID=UPI0007E858E7|nr:uncharacterized protein LOC108087111 [Drosophila ficusphila]
MKIDLNQMAPVLFALYTIETLINMFLIHFNLKDFVVINLRDFEDNLPHIFYVCVYYIFTLLTAFASINLCTGNQFSIIEEVVRPLFGFITYTVCSLLTLGMAEADTNVLYRGKQAQDLSLPEKPLHPYFDHLRYQAKGALVASVVYLLHFFTALDVLLSNEESEQDNEQKDAEHDDDIVEEEDYVPVRLYIFGRVVHTWLEQFEWFQNFTRSGKRSI